MFLINIIHAENHFCFLGYFLFYKVKSTEFIQNKTFMLHYKCIFFIVVLFLILPQTIECTFIRFIKNIKQQKQFSMFIIILSSKSAY